MRAPAYLLLFTCLALLGFGVVAAFNYTVDPYRFYDAPDREGYNAWRHRFFYGQVVSKPYLLREQAPEAVILGVSRAGSSMDTAHPAWGGRNVHNYAIAGSSAYLLWRNYQHARGAGDIDTVLLMLDMYMFNVFRDQRPRGYIRDYEERLSVTPEFERNHAYPLRVFKDTLNTLVSFEMLYESWRTVDAQARIANGEIHKSTLLPTGFWINEPPPGQTQRRIFRQIERQYMTITWYPRPAQKFALRRGDGSSNLVYLQRILEDAHENGIDLRLGFMPFHARLAEAMRASNVWDEFEQWKRDVVALVEATALENGAAPFPLWEFTGYNPVNTEPVPLASDKETRMRWHLDASHVSPETGDLIQSVMLNGEAEPVPGFGVRVDSGNIEAIIRADREAREQYAATHPDDLAEVQEAARNTESWRRPQTALAAR